MYHFVTPVSAPNLRSPPQNPNHKIQKVKKKKSNTKIWSISFDHKITIFDHYLSKIDNMTIEEESF